MDKNLMFYISQGLKRAHDLVTGYERRFPANPLTAEGSELTQTQITHWLVFMAWLDCQTATQIDGLPQHYIEAFQVMLMAPLYSHIGLTLRYIEAPRKDDEIEKFWDGTPYGYRDTGEEFCGFFHKALTEMWQQGDRRGDRPARILAFALDFMGINQGDTDLEPTLKLLDERSVELATLLRPPSGASASA